MQIRNFTPHQIMIFDETQTISDESGRRLFLRTPQEQPILVFPSEGILSCRKESLSLQTPEEYEEFSEIIVGETIFVSHDPIPEGDLIVVSGLFKEAVRRLSPELVHKLGRVDSPIYDPEAIRPIGCLGIAVG